MEGDEPKIIPLSEFLNAGFNDAFGMTREQAWEQGVCVQCKEPALEKCYSDAGRREYKLSAMCEPCFDALFADPEEGE